MSDLPYFAFSVGDVVKLGDDPRTFIVTHIQLSGDKIRSIKFRPKRKDE